jgi:hypothetical protein
MLTIENELGKKNRIELDDFIFCLIKLYDGECGLLHIVVQAVEFFNRVSSLTVDGRLRLSEISEFISSKNPKMEEVVYTMLIVDEY